MMQLALILFWFSLSMLAYIYAGYPLLLAGLACLFTRKRPAPDNLPFLSVLIAAYNEEGGIRKKLEETLALDYPADSLEVFVLSDGSTDRTDEIVRTFSDPRVHLLHVPGRKGKTWAQNEGVKVARGEVMVFSDATTIYHPQALRFLASNYADPRVGAASGRYQYFDPEGKSPTGLGTVAFWNYENFIKMMQSRIRTISGCCGCIYSVRRQAYTALEADVISDLVQPLQVIRKGFRVVFEDRALAYEETTQSTAQEFSMRVRVVARGIRGLLSVPQLLNPIRFGWIAFQLWSHKIFRWLVPLFLILLLLSNFFLWRQTAYQLFLIGQLIFYFMALFSLLVPVQRLWRPLGIPLYFCTLNVAALFSLFAIVRGKKYVVWETVRT